MSYTFITTIKPTTGQVTESILKKYRIIDLIPLIIDFVQCYESWVCTLYTSSESVNSVNAVTSIFDREQHWKLS